MIPRYDLVEMITHIYHAKEWHVSFIYSDVRARCNSNKKSPRLVNTGCATRKSYVAKRDPSQTPSKLFLNCSKRPRKSINEGKLWRNSLEASSREGVDWEVGSVDGRKDSSFGAILVRGSMLICSPSLLESNTISASQAAFIPPLQMTNKCTSCKLNNNTYFHDNVLADSLYSSVRVLLPFIEIRLVR